MRHPASSPVSELYSVSAFAEFINFAQPKEQAIRLEEAIIIHSKVKLA